MRNYAECRLETEFKLLSVADNLREAYMLHVYLSVCLQTLSCAQLDEGWVG